uniref:Uncharacterized protein n=1 Tax=Acrobeloides nanus TaxID=290746 RepID=A0A914DWT6_9BILA
MNVMPKTLKLLKQRGVEFKHGFVSTPICCPSRSSILTGLYVHNHNVMTNNQNCSGPEWRNIHEQRTFAVYLKEIGYDTGYFGKYLNEYDGSYIPPGWTSWMGQIKNSRFYNYTINLNGVKIKHGFDYEEDYFTDRITNQTLEFIQDHVMHHAEDPFLAVVSYPAPHGPEDPAPQYSHLFDGVETHRTESWNYAPNPDKQWLLQHTGKMEPAHVVFTDLLHKRRLQTLQSVDDAVHKIASELRFLNELSNTFIIFTSDHGYHLGQFGLIKGKNMPYEFDIKVPFFMRGPGLQRDVEINSIVSNIDIAPTIIDMAGLNIPKHMDGRSILDLIGTGYKHKRAHFNANISTTENKSWRQTLLIERGKMPKLGKIRDRFLKQREKFKKEIRIDIECSKPEYQAPCKPNQHWHCLKNAVGRWRIYKCRENGKDLEKCKCGKRRNKRDANDSDEQDSLDNMKPVKEMEENEEEMEENQWFQGIMDDDEIVYPISAKQRRSIATFRPILQSFEEKDDSNSKTPTFPSIENDHIEALCQQYNSSIFCHYLDHDQDLETWNKQKKKIDGKIATLRMKLSTFKDIRKQLRQNRPTVKTKIENEENSETCKCEHDDTHPLLKDDVPITDQELLEYQNRRRESRRRSKNSRIRPRTDPKTSMNSRTEKALRKNCSVPQMNCFKHNAEHWKTPPFWPEELGEFCFCQNSNNNTYWCLRTVNETHNFLYCEFITNFISYYDLNSDPYQKQFQIK